MSTQSACRAVDPQDRLPAEREKIRPPDERLEPERIADALVDYERCVFALRESIFEAPGKPGFSEQGEPWFLSMQKNALLQCKSDLHLQFQGHRPVLKNLAQLFGRSQSALQSAEDLLRMHELLWRESDPEQQDPSQSPEQRKVILTAQRIRTQSAKTQLQQELQGIESALDQIHRENDEKVVRIINGRDPVWRASGRALYFALRSLRRCIETIPDTTSEAQKAKYNRDCVGDKTRVSRRAQQLITSLAVLKRSPLLGLSILAQCSRDCIEAAAEFSESSTAAHTFAHRQRVAVKSCGACELSGLGINWSAM